MQALPFLSTAASVIGGISSFMKAKQDKAALKAQAVTADQNASLSIQQAQTRAQENDLQSLAVLDKELSAQGGSGISVRSGSFLRQRQLNRSIATLNSARIVEDGRLEGRNYQTQAAGLRAQARAISPFMTLVTAAIGTGASYIGDSTRVAENTARAVTAET